MPLIRPEIQSILRETGISPSAARLGKQSISEQLDEAGLSISNLLEQLSALSVSSSSDQLKARVLETALKMHGVLKEQAAAPPAITINITDPYGQNPSVNPILIPRAVKPKESESIQ